MMTLGYVYLTYFMSDKVKFDLMTRVMKIYDYIKILTRGGCLLLARC